MLILSASFQIERMIPEGNPVNTHRSCKQAAVMSKGLTKLHRHQITRACRRVKRKCRLHVMALARITLVAKNAGSAAASNANT